MADPLTDILLGQQQFVGPTSPQQDAFALLQSLISQQLNVPEPTAVAPVERTGVGLGQAALQGALAGFQGRPVGQTGVGRQQQRNRQDAARQDQRNLAQLQLDRDQRGQQIGEAQRQLGVARQDEATARGEQIAREQLSAEERALNARLLSNEEIAELRSRTDLTIAGLRSDLQSGKVDSQLLRTDETNASNARFAMVDMAAQIRAGTEARSAEEIKRDVLLNSIALISDTNRERFSDSLELWFERTVAPAIRERDAPVVTTPPATVGGALIERAAPVVGDVASSAFRSSSPALAAVGDLLQGLLQPNPALSPPSAPPLARSTDRR